MQDTRSVYLFIPEGLLLLSPMMIPIPLQRIMIVTLGFQS